MSKTLDEIMGYEEPREEPKPDPMEKIRALVGGEEFKLLAEECVKVAPGLIKHDIVDTFIRRAYLFAINDGEGLTTYLELFAQLLSYLKLMDIRDSRSIMEMTVSAASADKTAESISSVCNAIRRTSGGRILCIDISE